MIKVTKKKKKTTQSSKIIEKTGALGAI